MNRWFGLFSKHFIFAAAPQAAGAASEEAGIEVPEAVTVVVEETHPLPEVSIHTVHQTTGFLTHTY